MPGELVDCIIALVSALTGWVLRGRREGKR